MFQFYYFVSHNPTYYSSSPGTQVGRGKVQSKESLLMKLEKIGKEDNQ